MSSRKWQVVAAVLSLALMSYVLVVYGLRDPSPPTKPGGDDPHAGAQHHTAEEHAGDAPAPLQPFSSAKVGDWIAVEQTTQLANGRPSTVSIMIAIEAVDDARVTLVRTKRETSTTPPEVTRDTRPRSGLKLDQLVGNDPAEFTLHSLTVTDDTRTLDGRAFPCKRLSFALQQPLGKQTRADADACFSPEVPVDGLVELRQTFPAMNLQVTTRLVGFGTADTITWGTKPDGL